MVKIAQYKGTSWTSKSIQLVTRGPYSHTAIILGDERIVEAWQGCNKVRVIESLSDGHKPGTVVDIYTLPFTEGQEKTFTEYVDSRIGCKYDYWGLVAFFLDKGEWNRENRDFCSELFCNGCIAADFRLFASTVEGWQVSPSMITRTPFPMFEQSIVTTTGHRERRRGGAHWL